MKRVSKNEFSEREKTQVFFSCLLSDFTCVDNSCCLFVAQSSESLDKQGRSSFCIGK
jgi:hypothetical protein